MHQITIKVGGREVTLTGQTPEQREKARQDREARVELRDEHDVWPDRSRAAEARLDRGSVVPKKRDTKGHGKVTQFDWSGCGAGSNSNRGVRAFAGLLRAISAEETGCLVADEKLEKRLRPVMKATTDRAETGMQVAGNKQVELLMRRLRRS